jgi:hypothetical protein
MSNLIKYFPKHSKHWIFGIASIGSGSNSIKYSTSNQNFNSSQSLKENTTLPDNAGSNVSYNVDQIISTCELFTQLLSIYGVENEIIAHHVLLSLRTMLGLLKPKPARYELL